MTVAVVEYKNAQFLLDSDSMAAAHISKLASAQSLEYAELAGRYANDDTDTDVVGGSSGDRGAKYWADDAETRGAAQVGLAADQAGLAATARSGSEAAKLLSEQARDIAQAAVGVTYLSEALALSGSSDGDRFTYWDGDNIVFAENDTGVIVELPGPWFDQDRVGEKTVAAMLASSEGPRGAGSLWKAGGYRYVETDEADIISYANQGGYHLLTSGGVKLHVQPNSDGFYHSRAFGIEPTSNNKAALTAFLTAGLGGKCLINQAIADYHGNYLPLYSGSIVVQEPGCSILGIDGAEAIIWRTYTTSSTNIVLSGYGAYVEMHINNTSQTINLGNAPENVLIEGLEIKGPAVGGAATESDCIYIGGIPDDDTVSKNIVIRDVIAYHARRNIVSIVAGHGVLIENCDLSETLVGGVFRRIVDFEANRFMANGDYAVKGVTLRKCRLHNSENGGALISWAQQITIDDCDIYGIKGYGVQLSPGGNIFNSDRNTRPGDILGVVSIVSATGWIKVSNSAKLIDDYGIRPGTYCIRGTRDGGAWPAEISGGFYVEDISADQLSMRVSLDWGFPILTTTGTGSAGTGSFDEDGDVSALWIGAYVDDDQVEIKNTRIWGTTDHCISIVGFGVTVQDCKVWPASAKYGVNVQLARDVSVKSNKIYGDGLAQRGIVVQGCSEFASNDNTVIGTTKAAIFLSGATGSRLKDDKCTGCDSTAAEGIIMIDKTKRSLVDGAVLRSSTALPSKYGVRTGGNTENCLFINVDGTTTGSSNATSISIGSGTGNRSLNCWKKDGTWNS